jgi:hypothetical protein
MGMDFSATVYSPNFDTWGRQAVFTPAVSQPGGGAYSPVHGVIWHSDQVQVVLEDNSFLQDQQTTIDILLVDFPIPPVQDDYVNIPADGAVPAEGDFQIINVWDNGGGEATLQLRKMMIAP